MGFKRSSERRCSAQTVRNFLPVDLFGRDLHNTKVAGKMIHLLDRSAGRIMEGCWGEVGVFW